MEPKYEKLACSSGLGGALEANPDLPESEIKMITDGIVFYRDQFKHHIQRVNGISATASFHQAIDREIEALPAETRATFSCRKGCAHCCRINVDITSNEAELIVEYCKASGITIDIAALLAQRGVSIRDRALVGTKGINCVFLDKNDACTIYEHRPSACRKYNVVTDPDLCNFQKHDAKNVGVYLSIPAELIASGMINVGTSGSMAEMILRYLKIVDG